MNIKYYFLPLYALFIVSIVPDAGTGFTTDGSVTDSLAATTAVEVGANDAALSTSTPYGFYEIGEVEDYERTVSTDSDGDSIADVDDIDDDNDGIIDCNEYNSDLFIGSTTNTFTFSTAPTVVGSGNVGTTVLYSNVGTFGGTGVDVKLTINAITVAGVPNASMNLTLSSQNNNIRASFPNGFGPDKQASFTMEIFETGTSMPIAFTGAMTILDIDNSGTDPNGGELIFDTNQSGVVVNGYTLNPTTVLSAAIVGTEYTFTSSSSLGPGNSPSNSVRLDVSNLTSMDFIIGGDFDNGSGHEINFDDPGFVTNDCPNVLVATDTDSDGIPDHLDLDSDGDGCYDKIEAGVSGFTTDGSVTDSLAATTAGEVGNNGLDNDIESDDTQAATTSGGHTGNYDITQTNSGTNDFQDAAVQAPACPCLTVDSDNDGICDAIDLDDDNDGVRDIDECPPLYRFNVGGGAHTDARGRVWTAETGLTGGAGTGADADTHTNLNSGETIGTTTDAEIYDSFRNAGNPGTFTYTLPITNGTYRVVFHWADGFANGNTRSTDIGLEGINIITGYVPQNEFGDAVAGSRIFTTTVNDGILNISYGGSGFPLLYGLEVFDESCNTDTDGDGIANALDLDSDGDGCYDKIEAGVTGFTTDGSVSDSLAATTAGEVGNNGLDNGIESDDTQAATTSGGHIGNYDITQTNAGTNDFQDAAVYSPDCPCLLVSGDSDNDGICDADDIDDDNDGILDTDEQPCNLTPTGAWTDNGDGSSSAISGTTNIDFSVVNDVNTTNSYTSGHSLNSTNFWSDPTVAGAPALRFLFVSDTSPENGQAITDSGTGIFTILFSEPQQDPIIHIDRLGGSIREGNGNPYFTTSTRFTVTTPDITMTKLSGNSQLIVTPTTFFREPDVNLGTPTPSTEANNTTGTAAGSIQINGTVSSLSFNVVGIGPEISTHIPGDGVEMLFQTCPAVTDTDNDGTPDHLDLDSDGDGCYDKIEAGVTGFTTDGSVTDSLAATTAGEVGDNGLDDDIESDDTQAATTSGGHTGNYDITQTNAGTNDFQDAAVQAPACPCLTVDSDNDGICDAIDIDDDNDGIRDIDECPPLYRFNVGGGAHTDARGRVWTAETGLTGGAGTGADADTHTNLNSGETIGTTTDAEIYDSFRNAGNPGTFTYTLPIANGTYRVVFHWADGFGNGNTRSTDIALEGTNVITGYAPQNEFGDAVAGSRIFTTTVNDGVLNISYGGSGFPLLYGLEVFDESCNTDTDGDGIANALDLDSDGDGCYDKIEAGVTGFTTDGTVTDSLAATTAGEVGNNGLDNDIESDDTQAATTAGGHTGNYDITQTNAGTNDFQDAAVYSPDCPCLTVDSDNDGICDAIDIDDDNDGIRDVDECVRYVAQNEDTNWKGATTSTVSHNWGGASQQSPVQIWTNPVYEFHINQNGGDRRYFTSTGANTMSISFSPAVPANEIGLVVGEVEATNTNVTAMVTVTGSATTNDFYASPLSGTQTPESNGSYNGATGIIDLTGSNENKSVLLISNSSATVSSITVTTQNLTFSDALFYSWFAFNTCDTDNDGIFDHLDLDSDGDGCYDKIEAGVTGFTTNGSVTDSLAATTAGEVGNNGLDDDIESNDTQAATTSGGHTGNYDITQTNAGTNDFQDAAVQAPACNIRPPYAVNDTTTTNQGVAVTFNLLLNDTTTAMNVLRGDSVQIITDPTQGNATYATADSSVTYTPTGTYSGLDSLQYRVCDTLGLCDTAWAFIDVSPNILVEFTDSTAMDAENVGGNLPSLTVSGGVLTTASTIELVLNGSPGTATPGTDYQPNFGSTVTVNIPAGDYTIPQIIVLTSLLSIIDDTNAEPDETFSIDLSNPQDPTNQLMIGDADGIGNAENNHIYTIVDDDCSPSAGSILNIRNND